MPIAMIAWNLPQGLGLLANLMVLAGLALVGMVGYIGVARLLRLDEPWIVMRTILLAPLRLRPGER